MSLSKIIIFSLCFLFLPLQSNAIFGLAGRTEQKQKIAAAREAYAKGNYGDAIKICEDFLMQNQNAPKRRTRRIYSVLGNTYVALGNYDKALLTYNEALELLPKNVDLNLSLADLYYKTELYDKAIEFYNKTLQLDKDNPQALIGLGRAYIKIGFLSKARQYFKEYLEQPGDKDPSINYEYANVNFLSNNLNTALDYALKAKKTDNQNPDIYFLISKIYNTLNAPKQAKNYIDVALHLSNNREDILLTSLLWKAYETNTANLAYKEIKEYQKQNPESQLAIFIEFISLLKQNKKDEALKALKKIEAKNDASFIKTVSQEILMNK